MEFFLVFFVLPMLGVIWFLNLISFLEKLHNGKNTHNQKVLGGFWTFVFVFALINCIAIIAS